MEQNKVIEAFSWRREPKGACCLMYYGAGGVSDVSKAMSAAERKRENELVKELEKLNAEIFREPKGITDKLLLQSLEEQQQKAHLLHHSNSSCTPSTRT